MEQKAKYRRVLLKLSGEAVKGPSSFGLDRDVINHIAEEIKEIQLMGIELGVVIGGGNIFRGNSEVASGMNRTSADYIGMVATLINALSLQAVLEQKGVETRVMTALEMKEVAEPYIRRRAIRHLELGRVIIFACGTGNPFFTTDTAAALRANEIDAQVFLKATNVDGIYDSDPRKNPNAILYKKISYTEALQKNLRVMDATAFSLCRENNLPIIVFNLHISGNIRRVIMGESVGTFVGGD